MSRNRTTEGKGGVTGRRRILVDGSPAGFTQKGSGLPIGRTGAMVEKKAIDMATGTVPKEPW